MVGSQQNNKCIMIEGNIGAGKSTFLTLLSNALDIQAVYEPHSKWQAVGGSDENLLDKFYKDTQRWAYTFQTYAFVSRVVEQEAYAKKSAYPVQILERSVYSDRYCFAYNAYELGTMSALEWKLYQEWFSWLVDGYTQRPSGFIYLRTTPEVCYQRMLRRNRSEESVVTIDYLSLLHKKHEDWLINKKNVSAQIQEVPVLVLECDEEFEQNMQEQEKHIHSVKKFLGMDGIMPSARSKNISLSL